MKTLDITITIDYSGEVDENMLHNILSDAVWDQGYFCFDTINGVQVEIEK